MEQVLVYKLTIGTTGHQPRTVGRKESIDSSSNNRRKLEVKVMCNMNKKQKVVVVAVVRDIY